MLAGHSEAGPTGEPSGWAENSRSRVQTVVGVVHGPGRHGKLRVAV